MVGAHLSTLSALLLSLSLFPPALLSFGSSRSPSLPPPPPPTPSRFFSPSTPLIFHSSSSLLVASDRSSSADTRKKCDSAREPERERALGERKGVKGAERAGEIHATENGRRKSPLRVFARARARALIHACTRTRAHAHTRIREKRMLCVHTRTHPNFSRHSAQLCHPHVSCGHRNSEISCK